MSVTVLLAAISGFFTGWLMLNSVWSGIFLAVGLAFALHITEPPSDSAQPTRTKRPSEPKHK
jgi:hypothetical protein